MTKDEKKAEKHRILCEDISSFIGDWEMSNNHYCRNEDIIREFSRIGVKSKKIKKALKEIR